MYFNILIRILVCRLENLQIVKLDVRATRLIIRRFAISAPQ